MGDLIEDRIIDEHERKKNEAYWKERAMTYRGPDKPYVTTDADREREQRYWDARDKGETAPIPSSLLIRLTEKGSTMTCRFEEEFYARPYPRSCPTCGLAGKCGKGYTQIKNEGKPGYAIQAPNGQVNFYGPLGQPEGSNGPIDVTMQAPPERMGYTIPEPKPVPNSGPMSLHKRLMLMLFLQQTFKITSEAELFELAKEIERLTRD